MHAEEPLEDFRKKYFYLCNFYECRIEYEGLVYTTSEHAFQAAKTLNHEQRHEMAALPKPRDAKKKGNDHDYMVLREDWESVKNRVMYDIVLAKFTQSSKLGGQLLSTGNAYLKEGNWWHDNYWGDCWCDRCKKKAGRNQLGKTLMRVRDRLKILQAAAQ